MTTQSLGEAIQDEIKRVSALRDQYLSLPGGVGNFGAMVMKVSIDRAINALAEGAVIKLRKCHEDLKGFTE